VFFEVNFQDGKFAATPIPNPIWRSLDRGSPATQALEKADSRFRMWPWVPARRMNGGEGWIRTSVRLRGQIYSQPNVRRKPLIPICYVSPVYRSLDEKGGFRASGERRILLCVGHEVAVNVDCQLNVFVSDPRLEPFKVDAVVEPVGRGNMAQIVPAVARLPNGLSLRIDAAAIDSSRAGTCATKASPMASST